MFIPTPEERIYFCRVCKNYKTDDWKRELCGLTDKPPVFEKRCSSFDLDPDASKKDFQRYTSFETTGDVTAKGSNRTSGILILVFGAFKFLASLVLLALSAGHGGLGITPVLFCFTGIIMIFAGIAKISRG